MSAALESWKASGHTQVRCAQCHEKPRPWYQFPQTLAGRSAMLTRDLSAHWSGKGASAIAASYETTPTITDATCLQCHGTSRKISMRFGTLINHEEHAKRNKSCVSCHLWTAHPNPDRRAADAPDGALLHLSRTDRLGQSPRHLRRVSPQVVQPAPRLAQADLEMAEGPRRRRKGGQAAVPRSATTRASARAVTASRCRTRRTGRKASHRRTRKFAKTNRAVCAKCHAEKPDLCSMCHHKGWDPAKGPWVRQHPALVANTGSSFCLKCHDPGLLHELPRPRHPAARRQPRRRVGQR